MFSKEDFIKDVKFRISTGIKKAVKYAASAVAGFASVMAMKYFHLTLSDTVQACIVVGVTGFCGLLLNYVKVKFPQYLGWL